MPCGMNLELELEPISIILTKKDGEDVNSKDVVTLHVKMLPILPQDGMLTSLKARMREAGWTEHPDGSLTRALEEAEMRLSPDGKEITVTRTTSVTEIVVQGTVQQDETEEQARDRLYEAEKVKAKEKTERENLARLTALEPQARQELQVLLNRTYREAIEQRAREMGTLESLVERGDVGGTYEVKVVIKA